MDDGGPTASYLIFFALLFIDVFFYGFSAAVKELNSKELSDQLEESGNKKVRRLYQIAVSPQQHIDTVQLVVTLINLTAGSFVLDNFERLSHKLIAGIIVLYILLTFGVLIPKKLGARYAHKWAYACINPIYYVTKILSPFTGLVSLTTKGILRIFGISVNNDSEDVTEEEIISMVNEGHEQGVLLATEAEMITKIFQFGDKEAQDIMTHRKNILAIDRNMTLSDALDYMLSESKSRFPVYEETIAPVLGILHSRDAMRAHREPGNMSLAVGDIDGLIRETMYIPETKNIDDLFKDMQRTKTQMVIVVDEYGQTTGLLAMEDILEEIVGNIMDEYDEDEAYIEETENDDEYIIEGITPLEELEERFEISFNEEEFETLNGFLISKMDKIPEENEEFSIDVDGYSFRILSVENRMIKSVLVTKLPEKEPDGDVQQTEEDNTTNKQE